jgi:hypothetical protein
MLAIHPLTVQPDTKRVHIQGGLMRSASGACSAAE